MSMLMRTAALFVVALALLWPLAEITDLIEERRERSAEAGSEIGERWGSGRVVAGPVLTLTTETGLQPDAGVSAGMLSRRRWHHLPEELDIQVALEPRELRRGLFDSVVYSAHVRMTGRFAADAFAVKATERMVWQEAELSFSVGDLRGLTASPQFSWQGSKLDLESRSSGELPAEIVAQGSALAVGHVREGISFALELEVRGSESLEFLPLGQDTRVSMTSTWPHPSFGGAFLPVSRELTADGFRADWSIPHLARGFGQRLPAAEGTAVGDPALADSLLRSRFGVELRHSVDHYQAVTRCTKYAILFIALTFGAFLLCEALADLRLHPVNYLLVGLAQALFYLLLLALAEHIGFRIAFGLAAVAIISLISCYSAAVLGTGRRALSLAATLSAMYGLLFSLVQLASVSLLVGSAALFVFLAIAMYLTRRLDWNRMLPVSRSSRSSRSSRHQAVASEER